MTFFEKFSSLSESEREKVVSAIIKYYKQKNGKALERIILQEGLFSGPLPFDKGLNVGPVPNGRRACPNCGKPL